MSNQVGSDKHGDWDHKQTQQYSQQQGGYLDTLEIRSKKNKQSFLKKPQIQTKLVKVWHEGAD
jgi:hypothetical protein